MPSLRPASAWRRRSRSSPVGVPSRRRRDGRSGGDGTSIGRSGICSSIVTLREASPHTGRAADVAAHHPGVAAIADLPALMEEVYRLFDRRCRTETALAKLARLRIQVGRCPGLGPIFQKLQSSRLGEGADLPGRSPARFDIQCGGTGQPPASQDAEDGVSGAHRATISGRIALDLERESRARDREEATRTLHQARAA